MIAVKGEKSYTLALRALVMTLVADIPKGGLKAKDTYTFADSPTTCYLHGLCRMTRDRERLLETLDIMKWLCREFWPEAFRKSVDKLQMNNMVRLLRCTLRM